MTKYAIIVNDTVHSTPEYAERPEFAPNIVLVELPEGSPVEAGWGYADGEFIEPEPAAIDWPSAIAARRWEAEVAGVDIAGIHVDTDDRSKLLINGAALEAMIDPGYVMKWKTLSGFVELQASQVLAVARAVRAHVQACFDREAVLLDAVANGTITDDMIEESWPGQTDYVSMTVAQLKQIAAEREISIPSSYRKADIIEALTNEAIPASA